MTRGERDYSKGKIYALVCNITGERYVGSTCKDYLSQRKVKHEADFKRWKKGKRGFVSSFSIIERGNYDMVLLEAYVCKSKDELHARERFWLEQGCVNKNIPTRTQREWVNDNKEKITQYQHQYYKDNKGKVRCECGSEVRRKEIQRHKRTKKHLGWEVKEKTET